MLDKTSMRINRYVGRALHIGRRKADDVIAEGRVSVNGSPAEPGTIVGADDVVRLDGSVLQLAQSTNTILLHKPAGYVCSRNGQGSKTVFELLPASHNDLQPVGRLDKDSSGLLIMTNDGELTQKLTHPSFGKQKVYEVTLDSPLAKADELKLTEGVELEDGKSQLRLSSLSTHKKTWLVTIHEGRNRQIRRSFAAVGHTVVRLHRIGIGDYKIGDLRPGQFKPAF